MKRPAFMGDEALLKDRVPDFTSPVLYNPRAYGVSEFQIGGVEGGSEKTWAEFWKNSNKADSIFQSLENTRNELETLKKIAQSLPFDVLVIMGMGAAVSCPATVSAYAQNTEKNIVFITDLAENIIETSLRAFPPERCGFLVISKSGSTLETMRLTDLAHKWLLSKKLNISKHLMVMTEGEEGSLRTFANREKITHQFDHPKTGGRFSVFSILTVFPGVFIELPMEHFLNGAQQCLRDAKTQGHTSTAARVSKFYFFCKTLGCMTSILGIYKSVMSPFGAWWCQLWAESLGKNAEAMMPIAYLGPFDHHTQWQLYLSSPHTKCMMLVKPNNESVDSENVLNMTFNVALKALGEVGMPYGVWSNSDSEHPLYDLGYLMMTSIIVVLVQGHMQGIDPFTQPEVETLKCKTHEFMSKI